MKIGIWVALALVGSMAIVSISYDFNTKKEGPSIEASSTPAVLNSHLMLTSNQVFNTALMKELPATFAWDANSVSKVGTAISTVWDKGVLDHKEMASLVFEIENASGEQISQYLAKPHLQSYTETAKKEHWNLLGDRQSTAFAPKDKILESNISTQ